MFHYKKNLQKKSGYNFTLPKTAQSILENIGDEVTKYRLASNKIAITTIESGKKSVKTWNENSNSFVDLNRNIIQYWLTAFVPK